MKKNMMAGRDTSAAAARISGTSGNDIWIGFDTDEVYNGQRGNDLIRGAGGMDRLYGGSGRDFIYGESGADDIFGGSERDTLDGGAGADIITGGGGADVFLFRATFGDSELDVITDFSPKERGEYVSMSLAAEFGVTTFQELRAIMVQDGDDVVMSFDGVDLLVLENIRIGQLRENDFQIFVT